MAYKYLFNYEPKKSTREAYGEGLLIYAEEYKNMVVLDADLSSATKTCYFKKKFPERHINCGIAEANMTGVAAGLSLAGYIPVMSSFAMFATGRNFEQIRNTICYPHLNVKIAATHAGITVGEDGATHQCNEDISLMRVIPGMTILVPSNNVETLLLLHEALKIKGPVYLRLSRSPFPEIDSFINNEVILGKGIQLLEGIDITFIGTGFGVSLALDIAKSLGKLNIKADVINIHTIKPIDEDIIIKSARKTRRVVTIEEHSVIGGLGDAVADVLVKNNYAKLYKIGIEDMFGSSGSVDSLLKLYGLTKNIQLKKIKDFFDLNY